PSTAALSTSYISGCGTLSNMASPANLTFPTVAYNSIILNWTPGTGSTKTYIVRKQGSIPTNKDDGTVVYNDNGNAFIDTGLTDSTNYCYALYGTDGNEYAEPLTQCQSTQTISGLVSHWKFDEGSGITAYDSAGTSNGTLVNGPTWKTSIDCISGGCLQFDGVNDYVNCGNGQDLNFSTGDFSYSLWFKIPSITNTYYVIFNKESSDYQNGINLFIWNSENKLVAQVRGGSPVNIYSNSAIIPNKFYHVVITRSGSNGYMYLNGELQSSFSSNWTSDVNTTKSLQFAYQNATTPNMFNGSLDEVLIYNKALSVQEVNVLYSHGLDTLGQCGSISGSNLSSAPTENLCSYGYPSTVSGTGPWTWSCSGTSSFASCSANKSINGVCGSANTKTYAYNATGYGSDVQCSSGTSSNNSFPVQASSTSWICIGENGGSSSDICTANRDEDPALVGRWPMNEGSGISLTDVSGKGNTGNINGATWGTEAENKYLGFDGINDYASCGTNLSLSGNFNATMSVWIKRTSGTSFQSVIVAGKAVAFQSFGIGINSANAGDFSAQFNGGNARISPAGLIPLNKWMFLTITKTPGTIESSTKLYLNGVEVSQTGQSGTPNFVADVTYIGAWTNMQHYFNGSIDDVRIYNRALSQSEIMNLYNNGKIIHP
ncbi:MAG: LamG domain-containing protein, partial [Candidatus Pacebacteria bacterium]|nr:LamG domain-containing protein [Candidatus Paceibacterota bacterium]